VLGNLVANALQAMPDGGELIVDVGPVEPRAGDDGAADDDGEGGPRVRLRVRDTGQGIPEEVRPHLFEPYFTTKSEGTGLGLAIAARVVEDLGGSIELAAVEGDGGTLATVLLPAWRDPGEGGGTNA